MIPAIIAGAGLALQVGGGIYSGIQARKDSKKQAAALQDQARLIEEQAQFDSIQTSRQFESLLGEQKVAAATSGGEMEGSILNVFNQTVKDKTETVNNIMKNAQAQANQLRNQARQIKKAGKNALISGILGAAGGAAQSGASFYNTNNKTLTQ